MNSTGSGGRHQPSARPSGAESVDHVRRQVDRLCWTGILLGLAFTMTNVQGFAANGARTWSLAWLAAWLLDPMVSLVLLAILRAEQVTARHGVRTGGWARAAKWFTLGATYAMNTWQAFTAGSPALVVLHSVPPLVVFVATEAITNLRNTLGQAITASFMNASVNAAFMNAPALPVQPEPPAPQPVAATRRRSFADYLATARAVRTSDVVVTPAWVREVTGCSRGLSSRVAAALRADTDTAGTGHGAGVRA